MQEIEFHCLMCIRNDGSLIDSAGVPLRSLLKILTNVKLKDSLGEEGALYI
jgi:hypothetical protein